MCLLTRLYGIRKYGYSVRGIHPVDHRILVRGTRYSAIPVMSVYGIHDVFLAEGTINGERFEFFIRNYLLLNLMPFNGLNPFSVDNVSIHRVESNVSLIESIGAKVIFLPPYFPDLNLLELVFGKIKTVLKEKLMTASFKQALHPEFCFHHDDLRGSSEL